MSYALSKARCSEALDIQKVPSLDFHPRGSTALLDALGQTIVQTGEWLSKMKEEDRPMHVVFVVLTDRFGPQTIVRRERRTELFMLGSVLRETLTASEA